MQTRTRTRTLQRTHGRRRQRHMIGDVGEMDGSEGGEDEWVGPSGPFLGFVSRGIVVIVVVTDGVVVVVEQFACCVDCVVDVRANNAQPTQELPRISVGQTTVSADVGRWREIGDI